MMSLSGYQTVNGGSADREAESLQALVFAHQAGDPEAFAEMVRQVFPSLYRHAVNRLLQPQAAEDAVQEALVRAYRALPSFRGDYRVSAWLHRILANVCVDEGKRRRREAETYARLGSFAADPSESADDRIARQDVLRAMNAAVRALPPSYREAIMLRDYMELDYADVAQQAGITEENARARVSRARGALRRILDSSAVRASPLVFAFRRLGRASVSRVQSVSALPASAPDLIASQGRMSIAATSVAMAVAAAVPAITMVSSPSPVERPAAPTAADTVATSPRLRPPASAVDTQATLAIAGISPQIGAAAPPPTVAVVTPVSTKPASRPSTTTTTSTTSPPDRTTREPSSDHPQTGQSGPPTTDVKSAPVPQGSVVGDSTTLMRSVAITTSLVEHSLAMAPTVDGGVRYYSGTGDVTIVDPAFGSMVVSDRSVAVIGAPGRCGAPIWVELWTQLPSGSVVTSVRGWITADTSDPNVGTFMGAASEIVGRSGDFLNGTVGGRLLLVPTGDQGTLTLDTVLDDSSAGPCALPPPLGALPEPTPASS